MAPRKNTKKAVVSNDIEDVPERVSMDELHTRIMNMATCKKNKR